MWYYFLIVVLLSLFRQASCNHIGYAAILSIVIVELVFAFSVGVICIVFSLNLFRALKESEQPMTYNTMPTLATTGNSQIFSENTDNSDYRTFNDGHMSDLDLEVDTEGLLEEQEDSQHGITGIFKTFTSYLSY